VYEGLVARGCSNPIKETSELTRVPYTSVQKIITNSNFEKKERKIKKFRRISENLGVEIKNIISRKFSWKKTEGAKGGDLLTVIISTGNHKMPSLTSRES
jgi:hypothetical protein